ncbi:MAG: hypothetical protein ASUL_04776 [Candidatus Aramenus sulfurataquae]|jgi:hypothetical protein|uniref:ORF D-335-like domain-containing protein n=3 Tax=Candidatus Aramenus sulfurataquae TaxID=1326980 RepID=W7KM36_9CREN|nr:MAG: hypothetical protein ASUL_04776 [Candidatus Aramenus sulfurataquae]
MREREGMYYVYKLENADGEVKEKYVDFLIDVVETYLKFGKMMKMWRYSA